MLPRHLRYIIINSFEPVANFKSPDMSKAHMLGCIPVGYYTDLRFVIDATFSELRCLELHLFPTSSIPSTRSFTMLVICFVSISFYEWGISSPLSRGEITNNRLTWFSSNPLGFDLVLKQCVAKVAFLCKAVPLNNTYSK